MYLKNGDKSIGEYLNGKEVGTHEIIHSNGEVTTKIYN